MHLARPSRILMDIGYRYWTSRSYGLVESKMGMVHPSGGHPSYVPSQSSYSVPSLVLPEMARMSKTEVSHSMIVSSGSRLVPAYNSGIGVDGNASSSFLRHTLYALSSWARVVGGGVPPQVKE